MSANVMETQDLYFSYGRNVVIQGLSLAVPKGKVYGFLGRNGAGKTTTLQMLLGILEPKTGMINFLGTSARRTTPTMKKKIGYVSQHQHFYDWMKVHRLGRFVSGFYPTWDKQNFRDLLEKLHIKPQQRVGDLSGGTKMKLAMALALAPKPDLLILDEPTAGVDPIARREILDLLRSVADESGGTVLFSTHHISEVEEIGDIVGVLHNGSLVYQGSLLGFVDHARTSKQVELEDEDLEGAFLAVVSQ